MKNLFIASTFLIVSSIAFSQNIKHLDAKFMRRGNIYAKSSFKDSTALGGFSESKNHPKKITENTKFTQKGLFLKIDDSKAVVFNDSFNGYKFYIVNKSGKTQKFSGSDGRLSVIAEAFMNNKWQPIEYLPSSWCGNSYHTIYLNPNEYWEFEIPKFIGKIKTKIRYCLEQGDTKIYSNEIEASVNKSQLTLKEGYKPNGLMDPYND